MGAMKEPAEEAPGVPSVTISSGNSENTPRLSNSSESPLSFYARKLKNASLNQRSNSFQKWKRQVQRAWKWGPMARDQTSKSSFNPEVLANQKRQWYKIHSQVVDHKQYKEPTSLFEQFLIVGLHVDADLYGMEDAFARRKTWESEIAQSEHLDFRNCQHHGPSLPILEPQILFQYPPRKRLGIRASDIPSFCFPSGVQARMVERTPSMSELNELVYGQEYMNRDDLSFIFSLKVGSNATFYGVCLHVQEVVQRQSGLLASLSPASLPTEKGQRALVSAPRCYCILTRVPFFELHFEVLNSIILQERLDRITTFVREMTFMDHMPLIDRTPDGVITDTEVPFSESPESCSTSDISDFSQVREMDKDCRKGILCTDEYALEFTSESDGFEKMNGSYDNSQASPEFSSFCSPASRRIDRIGSSESLLSCSVRSVGSEEDDMDEFSSKFPDDEIIEWAKEHNNDLLLIICGYHSLPIPPRGGTIFFQPLEHLPQMNYNRPELSSLGFNDFSLDMEGDMSPAHVSETNARLAVAEEALALSVWTTATVCRALSLESVLALLAGALLEKQIVVICPNLGILSALVLSIISLIRPFEWQSLLLPVLPLKMIDFLDAPVPFIVGIQRKPDDLRIKSSNIVCVNVFKDQMKVSSLPQLPRQKELVAELGPIHTKLSYESSLVKQQPVYKCSETQAEAAGQFLNVMRSYMESLCSNLRAHTITNVQSNNDRVSLLLKDSFVDSFSGRDRPFIRLFVETQLFSVLTDHKLSSFEHE